jgi:hypothetical protein
VTLNEAALTNLLPGLRRAFSSFDRSERRRLLDEIAKTDPPHEGDDVAVEEQSPSGAAAPAARGYAAALPLLMTILGAAMQPADGQEQ